MNSSSAAVRRQGPLVGAVLAVAVAAAVAVAVAVAVALGAAVAAGGAAPGTTRPDGAVPAARGGAPANAECAAMVAVASKASSEQAQRRSEIGTMVRDDAAALRRLCGR